MIFFSWKSDKQLEVLRESTRNQFLTGRSSFPSYVSCKHKQNYEYPPKAELKTRQN